jgi:hypothetical protein
MEGRRDVPQLMTRAHHEQTVRAGGAVEGGGGEDEEDWRMSDTRRAFRRMMAGGMLFKPYIPNPEPLTLNPKP